MTPPTWTSEDEAPWHAYFAAALGASVARYGADGAAESAALAADEALAEHRKRFPRAEGYR